MATNTENQPVRVTLEFEQFAYLVDMVEEAIQNAEEAAEPDQTEINTLNALRVDLLAAVGA